MNIKSVPFKKYFSIGEMIPIVMVSLMVCLILVPLPPILMDFALSFNMAASFLLVITVLGSAGHASLPVFPTLILLATLFRLSLNIASTRLILADGDAGRVIEAFGRFVAGDNLVVGVVVFVIMTVVQFVVIAKGSERVAEVAARFNLDAMPGKQMSIDAELRSGGIDQAEAQTRRQALELESQFYGAMDGAMKFVKGDAIAGIVIAIINVAGGFTVGMLQRDMPAGEAAGTYAILSIGDGLASQIPSLLVSIAAGICVTRVGGRSVTVGLGGSIVRDLSANKSAFVSTGVLLCLISLAPGLPAAPFLLTGIAAASYGITGIVRNGKHIIGDAAGSFAGPVPKVKMPETLVLQVDGSLIDGPAASQALAERVQEVRKKILEKYGVKVPGIGISVQNPGDAGIAVRLRGTPLLCICSLNPNELYILRKWSLIEIEGVRAFPGPDGSRLIKTEKGASEIQKMDGVEKIGPVEFVSAALEGALTSHLPELIGIQEVHELLEELQLTSPVLVRETVPRILPYPKLVELLKRLLDERVPIIDLRTILETASACGAGEGVGILAESTREALKRLICETVRGASATLDVVLVDKTMENAIADGIAETGGRQSLGLNPDAVKTIVASIKHAAGTASANGVFPAFVTDSRYRRLLKKLVEHELPEVSVLSYQELVPEMEVRPVGRAAL